MNDERHLKNIFWADSQFRIDYGAFGDIGVFDSTYRVNCYLSFVPFIGVNHHRSTAAFCCGIISDDCLLICVASNVFGSDAPKASKVIDHRWGQFNDQSYWQGYARDRSSTMQLAYRAEHDMSLA